MMQQIAEEVYANKGTRFGVADVPTHEHNGVDSSILPSSSIDQFVPLPADEGGVANIDILNGETINDSKQASGNLASAFTSPVIYVDPIPTIYGSGLEEFNGGEAPAGTQVAFVNPDTLTIQLWMRLNTVPGFTTGAYTLNGSLPFGNRTCTAVIAIGATSATLNSSFPGSTGSYAVLFSNGDFRTVNFTNGNTAISWSPGLTSGATATINMQYVVTATLNASWTGPTSTYAVFLSNGDVLLASFTNGSPTISFVTGMGFGTQSSAASSAITVSSVGWYRFTPDTYHV